MCWIISLTILYLSRHLWVTPIGTHTLQALQHSEITMIENMSNLKDENWKVGIFYEVTDRCYRLCGHHVDVHTDLKSTRTERQSDQSTPDLLKAVPMGECNRANIHNSEGWWCPGTLTVTASQIWDCACVLRNPEGGLSSVNIIHSLSNQTHLAFLDQQHPPEQSPENTYTIPKGQGSVMWRYLKKPYYDI